MARLRYNGLTATLGADLLTADTTITFASALTSAAGAVPTITGSDYIPLAVLDTDGSVLEILHLTAYTEAATTGTVTRAEESTTAADHASGLTVVNGLTVADTADFTGGGGGGVTFHGARVYATTSQTVGGAWTSLAFASESFDSDGYHSTSTNTSRLTVPTGLAGKYLVNATISYAADASGQRFIALLKNGTSQSGVVGQNAAASSSFRSRIQTADVLDLAVGDYIEVQGYQNNGGSLEVGDTTASGSAGETWASITYLGA